MSPRLAARLAALLFLAAAPATAARAGSAEAALPANTETRLRYSISLAGIPIARAEMAVTAAAARYASRLTWSTSGLAEVFAGSRGDVAASGRLAGRRPIPATYTLASGDGRKANRVMLAMAGGAVKAAEAVPPMRTGPDTVPLEPRHRVDVVDPLSATLMPAKGGPADGDDVCRRTLPIFDGWTRYDIRLTPKSSRPAEARGITGPIVVCAARWVPVAGHRADSRVTRFMAANEDLSIAFAHLEKADVWVPLRLSVRTLVGMADVELDRVVPPGADKAATDGPTGPAKAEP